MNKGDLIATVAENTSLKKADAEKAVNAILDSISEAMQNGEKVQLIGFGTFETRQRAARSGRNPQTGKEISIPASQVPTFKPGAGLKDLVK
ncbi:HU family DNA-binding protein [Effusibacillus dendaii]|uniref:Transcriptional regulator n=1 Tax=Effusibacillus dendaii TaxID=2743772 RepID=A0A7I8DB17_9BACL|nr:HU family DNA-binding protein [Effusibacillus dendaii]BCJ85710.1 transcriptional regulator [Effusibacillus dendaii]